MFKIKDYSLYLVISTEYSPKRSAIEIAKLAIPGGVDIIQMREKNKPAQELLKLAAELSKLCKENGVLFIVNDDPLIAKESGADGVHLGQEDMQKYSVKQARNILGENKIIGVSTHSLTQLKEANEEDVDYIAYGPIFTTKTKNYSIGTADIKEVLSIARKPVFFIGGINSVNLEEILKEGVRNIAVISAIIQADDIESAARSFKDRLAKAREILTR